ncbi:hypothetical protein [Tychonema sp. BBK16]|uniref:hypothetical protein n=1 Tax=Tychonema sp. BBK16 TaxID=2699888 RepID=UPI0038D31EEB
MINHWELGIGNWASGIGHRASGIGHRELGMGPLWGGLLGDFEKNFAEGVALMRVSLLY